MSWWYLYFVILQIFSILDAVEDVKSRSGTPDEVPTVPTSSNPEENVCPICHEEFDQFYKQDFTDLAAAEGKRKQLSDKSAGTALSNHFSCIGCSFYLI